ncbi:MAG: hypothetical protein ACHQHN_09205 [Sphingobacteriales bacterium]
MKKFIYVCAALLLAFQLHTFAQDIHVPADSVAKLLCKKWELDYIIFQGNKIDYPSSKPKAYIEFFKDGTLLMSGGQPTDVQKGTWEYDASKKTASMLIGEKGRKEIMELTMNQFAIFSDDPASDPDHPNRVSLKAKVYFKVTLK